jgi:hypothetical protein
MSGAPFSVALTANELVLLDGQCRDEVQRAVDRAKDTIAIRTADALEEREAAMVAKILDVARSKGRLTFAQTPIDVCPCCGRKDGYWPYARAGRYHRKGAPNYSAPKVFTGWDLDRGFVTVKNHISVGFCTTCRPRVEPVLASRLLSIQAETPKHWTTVPQRFQRHDNRKCTKCGWEGHEGQMRPLLTLMGNGTYQGGCPSCDAENRFLGSELIAKADGFTLVPTAALQTKEA